MLKRQIILAATTAAAIALGAGGVFAASQSGESSEGEAREVETVRTASVPLAQAIATAEQQSNGRAVSAEAEEDDSQVLYEIRTIGDDNVVDFQIDPQTGNVVKTESEEIEDDDEDEYAGLAQLQTTLAAAIASAEQALGGKAVYEVEVAAADDTIHKAYVDAASGEVVETEVKGDEDGDGEEE